MINAKSHQFEEFAIIVHPIFVMMTMTCAKIAIKNMTINTKWWKLEVIIWLKSARDYSSAVASLLITQHECRWVDIGLKISKLRKSVI